MRSTRWWFFLPLLSIATVAGAAGDRNDLWILRPVVRPRAPAGVTSSTNPIDAFVADQYRSKHLTPVGPADRLTLLRRVCLDLIGVPPTVEEQRAFVADESPDAYEKIVDRLLADPQYGVRYARHWLDVLRYSDVDEHMIAAPGIWLWRDWVIHALNSDLPYDRFVRAQLTGYRSTQRTQISATGRRSAVEPRPDDMFALGFLARGDVIRDGQSGQELALTAVDTISTAFMGLTVGCAKCHDHKFDPITRRDFYAMKALFDPLVLRKVWLGTPEQIFKNGQLRDEQDRLRESVEKRIDDLVGSYRTKLYDDRVAMLPADVQTVIRKPEKLRTVAERKIADDYYPILRIDTDKIMNVLPPETRRKYRSLLGELDGVNGWDVAPIPAVWTVEVDPVREAAKSYILTSGDPTRPELDHPVDPGWPFAPGHIDFRDGRIPAFSDWLTSSENPMFARVAVNRLWQWHFGQGLQKSSSDFGKLGGMPTDPRLLDWLSSEFVRDGFSMKAINRLIVTSRTYQLSSETDASQVAANRADPEDQDLWHFRLQRLDAEPIWDSIFAAAGNLDMTVGGPSFDVRSGVSRRRGLAGSFSGRADRRAEYMVRGFSTSRDVVPVFLQAFDVDDGRVPCPLRTQTVTAPQSLFMMNSPEISRETDLFARRLEQDSGGDVSKAIDLGYRRTLARLPSRTEKAEAIAFLDNDPSRLRNFAWLLFNLDEFIYVR